MKLNIERILPLFLFLLVCTSFVATLPQVNGDAAIIGQLAGTTIMVIKEGSNSLREVELGVKRLQQAGVNPRGFLINDTKRTTGYYPYYGRASIES